VWYREQFKEYLSKPGTGLLVIGYSFRDEHINKALCKAAQKPNFRMFVIDPHGVDVISEADRTSRGAPRKQSQLEEVLNPTIVGASSRSLVDTFSSDDLEFNKVMRFFTDD
jgi:hypothetical protein